MEANVLLEELTSEVLRKCSNLGNTSTGSPSSFEMARYWMDECLNNHSACPKAKPFLPTRVIDVGPPDGSLDPFLYQESFQKSPLPDEEKKYLALSHCWGKPPWFRTTKDTIDERRLKMPMSKLPRTFQDAVTATRLLGLRFCWIDSICIIQEDKEDWEKEAVRMCDYYQNALCTITSAHSTSTRGGLFVQRDGIRTVPFEINIQTPDAKIPCQFQPTPRREIIWGLETLPLYKRAWVLQEMILSSRALIFDPDGLRWECLSLSHNERATEGGIDRHHGRVRQLQKAVAHVNDKQDAMEALGDTVWQKATGWEHIIQDYMSRGLTNESDRLIAIFGVAEAMRKHTSDEYLAGLWRSLLPYGLLWHVRHYEDGDGRESNGDVLSPPPYRSQKPIAPSWSYASVNVRVVYSSSIQERPICKVIKVHVDGSPQAQQGKLTLYGDTRTLYMMREKKSILSEAIALSNSTKYKYEEDYGLKQWLVRPDSTILASFDPPKWRHQAQAIPGHWWPDEVVDPTVPVTFIAVAQRPYLAGMPSGSRGQIVHTLALIFTGHSDGEFRRVGYAGFDDCTWYGFDCCEYRKAKEEPYARLSRSWGRIKPPQLSANGTKHHPVDAHTVAHDPLPADEAYHPSVQMERRVVTIV